MARGDAPLGDVATRVLFENDKVKIWSLEIAPGDASDWHLHEWDYVTVSVEGEHLVRELEDGTREDVAFEPGRWTYHAGPEIHRVINDSQVPWQNLLIEIKD